MKSFKMKSFKCRWFAANIIDGRYVNRRFGEGTRYVTARTAELAKWWMRENTSCDADAKNVDVTDVSVTPAKEDVVMRAIGAPPLPLSLVAERERSW